MWYKNLLLIDQSLVVVLLWVLYRKAEHFLWVLMQISSVGYQWWLFAILKVLLLLWIVASSLQKLLRRWKLLALNTTGGPKKTTPAAAVDVLGATGEIGVRETKPPLPDLDPGPPPPPPRGDPLLDEGVDDANFQQKLSFWVLTEQHTI